ncbi:MAG: GIY-YIG nuclease family protein [Bacteroidaceae bacterium]|nr:GIY-YIG nuclease family protein [Bacteroidaceae bacterium]
MSAKEYIRFKDIEGAYERFKKATLRWKNYWWDVVVEIYETIKQIQREFSIDLAKRILTKKRGRRKSMYLEDVMEFKCIAEGTGAYVVQHFDDKGKLLWTKVGKADDAQKRLAQHFTSDYKNVAKTGICLNWFPAKNSNHAFSIEDILRDHFQKKGYHLMGNDRFDDLCEVTEQDWAEINARLNILATIY